MQKIIKLAITDFKIIFRDPSLRIFLVLPVLIFILVLWLVPFLVEKYESMIPYLPLILVLAVIENTQMFSFISSMVLIDEKETEVAKTYGIVPVTGFQYIVSRFLLPFLFTTLLNVVLFFVQPFFQISLISNLLLATLSGLVVPVYALGINIFVENRMKGLVFIKVFNMLVLIPIAAFFVPGGWKYFFGIFPTHWIFQGIERATFGLSATFNSFIGILFFTVLLIWFSRLFLRKHFV